MKKVETTCDAVDFTMQSRRPSRTEVFNIYAPRNTSTPKPLSNSLDVRRSVHIACTSTAGPRA